MEKDFHVLKK